MSSAHQICLTSLSVHSSREKLLFTVVQLWKSPHQRYLLCRHDDQTACELGAKVGTNSCWIIDLRIKVSNTFGVVRVSFKAFTTLSQVNAASVDL